MEGDWIYVTILSCDWKYDRGVVIRGRRRDEWRCRTSFFFVLLSLSIVRLDISESDDVCGYPNNTDIYILSDSRCGRYDPHRIEWRYPTYMKH